MMNAPIALFVYNRVNHTHETVSALKNNTLACDSDLFIFSDAAKSEAEIEAVDKVRAYINNLNGFRSIQVIEREVNLGLANSIIDGVTSVVNQYGRIIVLEDDMVSSPCFLQYMNDGLNKYEDNSNVASIHGYIYPIEGLPETFFLKGADCWGWATWKDRWLMFEPDGLKLLNELKRKKYIKRLDYNGAYLYSKMLADQISGKNNSWAIRWHVSTFLKDKLTLYPGKSLVMNIGNDGSGTHCKKTDGFNSILSQSPIELSEIPVEESQFVYQKIEAYFKKQTKGYFSRFKQLLIRLIASLGDQNKNAN